MPRSGQAFEVIDDGRNRERWLEARRVGVGGSEIAAVLGVGYGSAVAVYARKLGLLEEEAENAVMRFGKRYERLLAQDLAELTGRRTTLDGRLLRSRRYPWLLSTLDARQWTAPRQIYGAAELKTTRFNWESDEDTATWGGFPQHVYAQVQQQYAVTEMPKITCAVFNRLTCNTLWAEVPRDEEYIEVLVAEARDFMRRVELGEPPPPDASEDTARALGKLYAKAIDGKVLVLGAEWSAFADRWVAMKAALTAAKEHERELRNQIFAHLGDAECGLLPDGARFTAKRIEKGSYTVKAHSYREIKFAERR